MGFFSDVVNKVFTDEVKQGASKAAGDLDSAFKTMGDEISKTFSNTNYSNNTSTNNNGKYTIPEEYKEFPVLEGVIYHLDTKKLISIKDVLLSTITYQKMLLQNTRTQLLKRVIIKQQM